MTTWASLADPCGQGHATAERPPRCAHAPLRAQFPRTSARCADYSTVTLLARLRGLSTSQPRATAM